MHSSALESLEPESESEPTRVVCMALCRRECMYLYVVGLASRERSGAREGGAATSGHAAQAS